MVSLDKNTEGPYFLAALLDRWYYPCSSIHILHHYEGKSIFNSRLYALHRPIRQHRGAGSHREKRPPKIASPGFVV
jgi:hypothetical protein